MLAKGAPDVLLARAGRFLGAAGDASLEEPDRVAFEIALIMDGPPAVMLGLELSRPGS